MKLALSIIIAVIFSILPSFGGASSPEDNLRLSANLISDTHISGGFITGTEQLSLGLKNMKNDNSDALIVAGDIADSPGEENFSLFYQVLGESLPGKNLIIAAGNHDYFGSAVYSADEIRDIFTEQYNKNSPLRADGNYYCHIIKGYSFIVLCDERAGNGQEVYISPEQLSFLDAELTKAEERNKPAFVVCHYPLRGTNGQSVVGLTTYSQSCSDKVKTILEGHKNVFYISGHLHTGVNCSLGDKVRGFSQVEKKNGVTYISLPAFGSANIYGITSTGDGYFMEVYDSKVIFRAKNYLSQKQYSFSEFTISLS